MARAAKKSKAGPAKGGKLAKGKQGLALFIAIILVVLFFDSVIVLAAGMIPTGVAYMTDRSRRKHAARTVAWMNLAGCLIVILDLWTGGGSVERAVELLSEPVNWLFMFGSAGFGWVIYFMLPPIVSGYLTLSQELKLKELAKKQKSLEKEWGKDVRKSSPLDELEVVEEEIAEAAREAERRARRQNDGKTTGGPGAPPGVDDEDFDEDLSDTPAGRPIAGRAAPAAPNEDEKVE